MTPLGNLLRDTRKARGLSLQQLADLVGTSKSYVYEVEAGMSEPTIGKAAAWAVALKLSPKRLFDAAIAKATSDATSSV